MSIRGGQILSQAGKFVLDRVQTAGPGDLNISRDKVYELGNYESIGTTTGIPEISYDLESFDVTTEFEALLVGENPSTFSSTVGSNDIDFRNAVPIDIISPIKSTRGAFDIVKGAVIPYLTLSNATYRFGVGDNATQSFTLNGDAIYYTQGQPYVEEFTFTSGTPTYTLANTAEKYDQSGEDVYVLSVCLFHTTTHAYKRVYFDSTGDAGYTNTSTTFDLPADLATGSTYNRVKVTYGSQTLGSYTQLGNNPSGNLIHETTSVKPAAVRSQDLDVFIGTAGATPVFTRFNSVQNIEATWSVSLENDEELGNKHYVASDYDVPEVSGSIGVKPFDPADLWAKLSQITGVPSNEVIGPNITQTVPLEMRISHPDTGARIKTIYIPDARFNVPGFQGQVQSKMENTLNWSSESGQMYVYNGSRV